MIKKAVGFKADRDEIQVTQVKMPTGATEGMDEERKHAVLAGNAVRVFNLAA